MAKKSSPVTSYGLKRSIVTRVPNTQKRISIYHTLQKKLEAATTEGEKSAVQLEIDKLGGLDAYQKASIKGGGEKAGKSACAKYFTTYLKSASAMNESGATTKVRLLDVGSLTGNSYKSGFIQGMGFLQSYSN